MQRRERIEAFVETIWEWYAANKRTLPWRDLPDTDPAARAYKIPVSEIMLQQTQADRVKIMFKEFIEKWGSFQNLAHASNGDVLIAWRGMGYNRRALQLRDAARAILRHSSVRHSSDKRRTTNRRMTFPLSMTELTAIPGIGNYTAAAIRNFAFNIPTPCLDTNIRRILHRTFYGPEEADGTWSVGDDVLLKLASEVLITALAPTRGIRGVRRVRGFRGSSSSDSSESSVSSVSFSPRDAANWHAALMDFGSLVQTKKNPKWDRCPLTAKGIMKAEPLHYKNQESVINNQKSAKISEPGRIVGSKFIPNRIFRGRIVEALRDAPAGLGLEQIGTRICEDWNRKLLASWLKRIVARLIAENMIARKKKRYVLA